MHKEVARSNKTNPRILASLRSSQNYYHYQDALTVTFKTETIHSVLKERHYQVFAEWLLKTLEEQSTDLSAYLAHKEIDLGANLKNWARGTLNDKLIPDAAIDPARKLFWTDLQTVLILLRAKASVERADEILLPPGYGFAA